VWFECYNLSGTEEEQQYQQVLNKYNCTAIQIFGLGSVRGSRLAFSERVRIKALLNSVEQMLVDWRCP
jgi:hypothetical protein